MNRAQLRALREADYSEELIALIEMWIIEYDMTTVFNIVYDHFMTEYADDADANEMAETEASIVVELLS